MLKMVVQQCIPSKDKSSKTILMCGAGLDTLYTKLRIQNELSGKTSAIFAPEGYVFVPAQEDSTTNDGDLVNTPISTDQYESHSNALFVSGWPQDIIPVYINFHGSYSNAELPFVKKLFKNNLVVLDADLSKLQLENLGDPNREYMGRAPLSIMLALYYFAAMGIDIDTVLFSHSRDDNAPDTVAKMNQYISATTWKDFTRLYGVVGSDETQGVHIKSLMEELGRLQVWDYIRQNCSYEYVLDSALSCFNPRMGEDALDGNDVRCNACKACLRFNAAMYYMYGQVRPFKDTNLLILTMANTKDEMLASVYYTYFNELEHKQIDSKACCTTYCACK